MKFKHHLTGSFSRMASPGPAAGWQSLSPRSRITPARGSPSASHAWGVRQVAEVPDPGVGEAWRCCCCGREQPGTIADAASAGEEAVLMLVCGLTER